MRVEIGYIFKNEKYINWEVLKEVKHSNDELKNTKI